jgi:VanZ family protein
MSLIKSGFGRYGFAVAMLLTVLYGATDEFHQAFVPGRYATIGDVLADSIGALLGCLGASFIKKR